MQANSAEQIIAVELFSKTIESCERIIKRLDKKQKTDIVNIKHVNASLEESFSLIIEVLQSVVDSFFHSYCPTGQFVHFTKPEEWAWQSEANLKTLNSAKKLINFLG